MSTKVLYIEDDPINKFLVKRLLSQKSMTVFEASNGQEGIDVAIEVLPDLILMDMQMPGLDGYQTTKKIKEIEALSKTPVIALTAHSLADAQKRSFASGCDGFIAKPIDIKTFAEDILKYL